MPCRTVNNICVLALGPTWGTPTPKAFNIIAQGKRSASGASRSVALGNGSPGSSRPSGNRTLGGPVTEAEMGPTLRNLGSAKISGVQTGQSAQKRATFMQTDDPPAEIT